jgi:hypothetical protein
MRARATERLRVRSSPEVAPGNVLRTIPAGAVVEIDSATAKADGYNWRRIGSREWCAEEFLDLITEPSKRMGSLYGLHISPNGDIGGVLALLDALVKARKPLRGVLLFMPGQNNLNVGEIKTMSPDTEVIVRQWLGADYQTDWEQPNLRKVGYDYVRNVYGMTLNADTRRADFHQVINEPFYGAGTESWWEGALDAANELRIKLGVFCFAAGNPPLPQDNSAHANFWTRPSTVALLRRVKREGHCILMHAYTPLDNKGDWTDRYMLLRHKLIIPHLPNDLKDLQWRFGEFGNEHAAIKNWGEIEAGLKTAEILMRGDPVAWCALWQVGDTGGWHNDMLDKHLPALTEYLVKA